MSELSNTFVCLLGIGTVFVGLICIVIICNIMSFFVTKFAKQSSEEANQPSAAANNSAQAAAVQDAFPAAEKQAVVAGVCAVIAEELGTDANNIRVLSFKKL